MSVLVEHLEGDRTVIFATGILVEVEFEEVLGCHGLPSHRTFVVSLQPGDYIPETVNQTLKNFDIKNTYRLGMRIVNFKMIGSGIDIFLNDTQVLRGVCWQLNCTQRMELYSKENMKY